MLAGPLHPTELYAAEGNCVPQSGLPRFREASFDGAFPFGVVRLSDKDLPVRVVIKGFSPFVPGDSAASSLPVASLEYEVESANDPQAGEFVATPSERHTTPRSPACARKTVRLPFSPPVHRKRR